MSSMASYDDPVTVDSDIDVEMIDHDDISNYNPEQILPESPENIQKIRSWLEPTSYDNVGGEFRKHQAAHVAGTGAWLTSSTTYQEWLQSEEHGLLWIKGIPGSGKSVMAANLINEIAASNSGCPVLFFFFRQIIHANHEPQALLRDWLDQVLDYSPPLQKKLKTYLRRTIDSISMEDMWKDLKMALENLPGKAFCIADALDEMDQGNNDFLSALGDLGSWRPKTVKVLITSRPVPTVEDPLRLTPCLHLRLEEKKVDEDISKYVQYTLSNSAIPKSEWEVIMNAVPGRANGLFLYAKLAMDAFLEQGANITEVISRLPADLNVLYTDLLKEHARRSGVAEEIQHLILQAVTHASRPLRLLELAELIKVVSPDGSTRDLKTTKNLIRAACGPLLEILADETVSVIHHSFTEYLKGTTRSEDDPGYPILQRGPTHAALATSCLHYLQAGSLDSVSMDKPQRHSSWEQQESGQPLGLESRLQHPFFEYAINNWAHHANRSEAAGYDQTALNVEIGKLLGNKDNRRRWLRMEAPGYESLTPLHVAAKEGLISYTKEVLQTSEVDTLSRYGQTPLWMAAANGHAEVIRLLIAAGAELYPREPDLGLKPLHEAASKNHFEVVRAILEVGVDPIARTEPADYDASDFFYIPSQDIALKCACENGHLETVETFLSFIDEIEIVHRALAWAAGYGRWKVVARILQVPGVDVNNTLDGTTPLFEACAWPQDLQTIRILIQGGADPNVKCIGAGADYTESLSVSETSDAPTPMFNCLHQICRWTADSKDDYLTKEDDPEILSALFSLLVEAGVDVHQRTATGKTLLHRTVGSSLMTRLLLDAGVDANMADNDGCTPLHVVEEPDVMKLLIENGHASINAQTRSGQTPLLYMLDRSHSSSVFCEFGEAGKNTPTLDQLLEYNPDCKAVDHKGNGALHLALQQRRFARDRIRALLAAGADPNLKNQEGLTPLASLDDFESGVLELFDLLINAGADINAVDRDGATHLFRLFSDNDELSIERLDEIIQHLVDRGASVFARDRKGRTLLHQVIKHYNIRDHYESGRDMLARLDSLISRGVSLEAVDHYGNGLLHELALREENSDTMSRPEMMFLWEQLIERGLNVEVKNHAGRTPLHILCAPSAVRKNDAFNPRSFMPIDYVISRMNKVDCVDLDGITPLHIAVSADEFCANRLLDAGADPKMATYEGMTPLHIAARCRQSNMVGRLLDALRTRYGPTKPVTGINARTFDREKATPLFYACQSGRPETVALLLEAGADVKIGTPFSGCTGFESEDRLWKDPHPSTNAPENGRGVSAVKIQDTSRWVPDGHGLHRLTEQSTARLEEILDLVIEHGGGVYQIDKFDDGGFAIGQAIKKEEHYLAACLKEALTKHGKLKESQHEHYIMDWSKCLQPLTIEASIGTMTDLRLPEAGQSNHELVSFLLARRKYALVERLAHMGAVFLPTHDKRWGLRCNLSTLIRYGFSRLVDKIGTLEAESRLEKGDWHAFGDKTRPGLWNAEGGFFASERSFDALEPFIIEAVRRQLPNMDVVRLLVEKFRVDVNEMPYPPVLARGIAKSSALHLVAFGRAWWHVHQALPYLLEAGADINIRNSDGQTPLFISLGGIRINYLYGPYSMDATRKLIEAGADVNASDNKGTSCLALAHRDTNLIRLLRSHGATVTADVLFAAIENRNLEGLEEFLSGEVDANMRRSKKLGETEERLSQDHHAHWISTSTEEHEEYPLLRCPRNLDNDWILRQGRRGQQEADDAFQMMQRLLGHGANPLARFRQVETSSKDANVKSYVEVTVLHQILRNGWLVGPMLSVPGLDVNCRDSKGRTLLHAACEGRKGADYGVISRQEDEYRTDGITIFKKLLSLGADLEARDDFGRNVLHHMFHDDMDTKRFSQFGDSLAYVLDKAPNLMDQVDGDCWTPLYYAIRQGGRRMDARAARALLSAGADPFVVAANGESLLHVLGPYLEVKEILDLFEELVGRGLDVNRRNNMGDTPLFAFHRRADRKQLFCQRRGGRERRESRYSQSDDGMSSPRMPAYSPASPASPASPVSPSYSPILKSKPQELGITREREALQMLRRVGGDFFAKDAKGRGLLHVAAASRSVMTFSDLMELGLDTMLEDDAQQTPLDVAAAFENESVLQLFEKDKKDGMREAKVARSPLPVPNHPDFDDIYGYE